MASPERVLIIDDEPLIGLSFQRAFERLGLRTFVAADGESGRVLWLQEKPELILLDVLMPVMSGPELLKNMVKELGRENLGYIVLMSAYSGAYNVTSARQLGADEFVAKPFPNIIELTTQLVKNCQKL